MADELESFFGFAEGDIEPTNRKRIHSLIMSTDTWIVYLDDHLDVWWSVLDDYEGEYPEDWGALYNRVAHLETLSINRLAPEHMEPFRRLLGEAIARTLDEEDTSSATEVLDRASAFLEARSQERARTW